MISRDTRYQPEDGGSLGPWQLLLALLAAGAGTSSAIDIGVRVIALVLVIVIVIAGWARGGFRPWLRPAG